MDEICAVVVLYNPTEEHIRNIEKLSGFIDVFVLDNSVKPSVIDFQSINNIFYQCFNRNLGIAYGFNQGLAQATKAGKRYAVLLDQDSAPEEALFQALLNGIKVADDKCFIMAPVYVDQNSGQATIFKTVRDRKLHILTSENRESAFDVDYVISSGSCVKLSLLPEIGEMEEQFFIDMVDIEWCFRAKYKGYRILVEPKARMNHCLGDERLKVFGRYVMTHSPVRHYYFTRNFIHLFKRKYVPFVWIRHEARHALIFLTAHVFFSDKKFKHFTAIMKGCVHGIIGRYGPI